jgi:aminoglycoside phosphotransferase
MGPAGREVAGRWVRLGERWRRGQSDRQHMDTSSFTVRGAHGPDMTLLRAIVHSHGLPCEELSLLPPNSKRVVISDRANVVIRCQLEGDAALRSPAEELAWALRAAAAVAVQAPLLRHPIVTADGWVVSVWQFLVGESVETVGQAREHGALVRSLHDGVPVSGRDISDAQALRPSARQLSAARARLEALSSREIASALSSWLPIAEEIVDRDAAAGDLVVCHGDVNPNTALGLPEGLALTDFDSAGAAPRVVDIASGAYTYDRYLGTHYAQAFLDGYGRDAVPPAAVLADHMWVRHLRVTVARALQGKDVTDDLAQLTSAAPGQVPGAGHTQPPTPLGPPAGAPVSGVWPI